MSQTIAPTPKELPSCPKAGSGVHAWIMEASWACRINGMTAETAAAELHSRITRKPSPANEIETAVGKVFETPDLPLGGDYSQKWPKPTRWSVPNVEQIEAIAATGGGLDTLRIASPIRFNCSPEVAAKAILKNLFPDDPWLCVGSKFNFNTLRLSTFAETAHTFEQIVPSPMMAKYGKTQAGKLSEHTLNATGPRRFLVIEGDGTSKEQQASVLLHLATVAPLSMVVDSGGKSLHGWFFVAGKSDAQLTPFFNRACGFGADPALWTRSQFVRMPSGTRDNGNRQNVLYYNAGTLKD